MFFCLSKKIPHLILQPLIENAIKHGISSIEEVGKIVISAKYLNNKLALSVSDNGLGMKLPYKKSVENGIGLENTISRLKTLYGNGFSILFENNQMGGLTVNIYIEIHDES